MNGRPAGKGEDEEQKKEFFTPLRIIGALVLAFILLVTIVPITSVKLNPEPKHVPGKEIIPADIDATNHTVQITRNEDFLRAIEPSDPVVKRVADRIASESCESGKICQAKAVFYFVRDNFDYVSDPLAYDYVKSARESLASGGGDCDDAAILLASLEEAIGVPARFAFIPGHVYVQVYLEEAPGFYKNKDGWIDADATCSNCGFGEIPKSANGAQPEIAESR